MWWEDAVVYQIYPLGLCGAPAQNSGGEARPRIRQLLGWVQHIKSLGAGAVLFNPVWESDAHGYDTRDYFALDARLGTNEDFAAVCKAIHGAGMKVMLDGVFNHVGRGFWAFRDVQQKKRQSPYQDWFCIDFGGNSNYGDGFWYEGWEGHYELVKLNLQNPSVVRHQFDAIREWVRLFDIDGLRLDVAYCLPPEYLRALRAFTNSLKPGFVLLGEALHGGVAELGYVLGRAWWNKGYMSEALAAVVEYLFTCTPVHSIAAWYEWANPASGAVLKKQGFVYEKEIFDKRKVDSPPQDTVPCAYCRLTKACWAVRTGRAASQREE